VDPELAEIVGDEAEVRVEGVLGYQRNDGPGDEHGKEDRGPQPVTQRRRHFPVYRQGQTEPHQDVEHDAGDRELGCYEQGFPGHAVVQQVAVVAEPDKLRGIEQVIVEQAQDNGPDQRPGDETDEQQEGGTYEQVGRQRIATLAGS
jgi:hypothetical protein